MPIPPIFLSHAGEDAEAVRLLSRRLKEAGLAVWLDVERMRAGESWMACQERALRQAGAWVLWIGKQDVGSWLDREGRLALERSLADPAFRIIPILGRGADPGRIPLWLSGHPGLDLRGHMPESADLRRIFGTVLEQSPQRGHLLAAGENPFQGLSPFGADRAHLFFGRDEEVEQMLEAMARSPFLALVGQAGVGKTSLLQAGLLPALRRGRFYAHEAWVERWRIAYMRPQDDPFRELAKALPDLGTDLDAVARQDLRRKVERKLEAGIEGLEECVRALVGAGRRSLIVVDQFEDLFIQTERPERRKRFLDSLFRVMGGVGDRQVHVLLSMRADYYGHAFEHSRLPALLARNQFPLRPPHPSLIKEIVEKPTHWAGARLQQGLLVRILDAAAEPGAGLAQLQSALSGLWRRRRGETLSLQAWEEMGGMLIGDPPADQDEWTQFSAVSAVSAGGAEAGDSWTQESWISEGGSQADPKPGLFTSPQMVGKAGSAEREIQSKTLASVAPLQARGPLTGLAAVTRRHEAERSEPAQRASSPAHSRELAELSARALDRDPLLGLILAVEAGQGQETPEAVAALRAAIRSAHLKAVLPHEAPVTRAVFTPDGNRIITCLADGKVRIFERLTGKEMKVLGGGEHNGYRSFVSDKGRCVLCCDSQGVAQLFDGESGRWLYTLEEEQEGLREVVFAADARCFLTITQDGQARVYETRSGRRLLRMKGPRNWLASAVFHPEASQLLTYGAGHEAFLWDCRRGSRLASLTGHSAKVEIAIFSHDGRSAYTGAADNTVRIWDLESGRQSDLLKGHGGTVWDLDLSPDGKSLLSTAQDGAARIWDLGFKRQPVLLEGHGDWVRRARFTPDGSRVLTASLDGKVRIFDVDTGHLLGLLVGHENWVTSVLPSPDGRDCVSASKDGSVRLWSAGGDGDLEVLLGHRGEVSWAGFSRDGRRVISASQDGTARIWGLGEKGGRILLDGHQGPVFAAAFSPDGRKAVTACRDGKARIFDAAKGHVLHELQGHRGAVHHARFNTSGSLVLTIGEDRSARIWSAETGQAMTELWGHRAKIESAAFCRGDLRVVTAGNDATARVWDPKTGEEIHVFRGHEGTIPFACFSPDASLVLTASHDGTARLWDVVTGREAGVLWGHEAGVLHAAFHQSGASCLTASNDGTVRHWDLRTHKEILCMKGHGTPVVHVTYSPDGKRSLSAGYDGTARLVELADGNEVACFRGHRGLVSSARFSPDGHRIVTAGSDGTVRLFVIRFEDLLALAESRIPITLGLDERTALPG